MERLTDKCDTANNRGFVDTKADGTQYFVIGKNRIKISEHFANNGKQLDSLLENVIQNAAIFS